MKDSTQPVQPAQSPTRPAGGILGALTGMFSSQSAVPVEAPTAAPVPLSDEPTVAAAEDRVPSLPQAAPFVDVALAPLPASLQKPDDDWQDASHLLADGGSVAQAAPAQAPAQAQAQAPAQAPSGFFAALAAGYNAGRMGEALPGVAPADQAAPAQAAPAQAAPTQSTPSSTGIFGRSTSLVISAPNQAVEASAAAVPSPSGSSETPSAPKSLMEALAEGYRAGSTPKPEPVDTAGFVARLGVERASPNTGASSRLFK